MNENNAKSVRERQDPLRSLYERTPSEALISDYAKGRSAFPVCRGFADKTDAAALEHRQCS